MSDALFGSLPDQRAPRAAVSVGRVRLREPVRDQIELRSLELDAIIGTDHPVRLFWGYVSGIDLRALENAIKSREGRAGHPAASPRLLLALWLFATSEGIGSARALDDLCRAHDAYRWLCGGVSLNYHTLADFRVAQGALLDRLLTQSVVALAAAGLIDLGTLSHDGLRVRAAAGASSFRRRARLEEHLAQAGALVARLKAEVDADPAISRTRARAAKERAAREREERVARALAKLAEIEARAAKPEPRVKTKTSEAKSPQAGSPKTQAAPSKPAPTKPAPATPAEPREPAKTQAEPMVQAAPKAKPAAPRVSTTDPEARVIKMPDGGFRPAYNVQVTTAAGTQIITGIAVATSSSDRGLLKPTLEQMEARYGKPPGACLADGGFSVKDDIEWAAANDTAIFCPPIKTKHGTDPFTPRDDDGPGVAAWRLRMASVAGQARYRLRAITECVHGRMRQNDLHRLTVRGIEKTRTIVLLHALSNNILQGHRLAQQAL